MKQPQSSSDVAQQIVVVDDDPDIRLMMCAVLERQGFRVSAFDDGQSALDSASERPQLILLDYMMPRLNAAGFLRARHEHQFLKGVPVVVISAYPDFADTVAEQAVGVVHKPIDMDVLIECVQYHCGAAAPQAGGCRQDPSEASGVQEEQRLRAGQSRRA